MPTNRKSIQNTTVKECTDIRICPAASVGGASIQSHLLTKQSSLNKGDRTTLVGIVTQVIPFKATSLEGEVLMCPCGQLPAGSITQVGIPELAPVDCTLCVTLVSSVVCLSTTKYQSGIRLCSASTVQLNIANFSGSGICRINVNTIFALGMAQNDHITRTKMCAGGGFSTPCNLGAVVDPEAETIHAIGLEALSNHRVCGRIFVDSIVQRHNPAAVFSQQRYAGIDIILASKDLRLVEQNFLFHVAKGEVVAHLDGDSVFVRNNTLLQIHLGHGINLNRAQVT